MIQVILLFYIICLHIALYFQHRRISIMARRQYSHEAITLSLARVTQQLGQKAIQEAQDAQEFH
jgi:hypothetical protein